MLSIFQSITFTIRFNLCKIFLDFTKHFIHTVYVVFISLFSRKIQLDGVKTTTVSRLAAAAGAGKTTQ